MLDDFKVLIIVRVKAISNPLIILFLLSLPFSHAPSIYGPYFTFPFITSIFLIFYFTKNFLSLNSQETISLILFLVFIFIMIVNSFVFNSNAKLVQYIFAYTWFVFFILISITLRNYFSNVPRLWVKVIFLGVVISVAYNILELYMILHGDGKSLVPRYDRNDYVFYSPVGFRVRGFNYESSNYALYISVVFSFLFFKIKSYLYQLVLVSVWVVLLLLTFSSLHIFLFLFFILPLLILNGHFKFKLTICFFILIISTCFIFIYFEVLMQIINAIFSKLVSYVVGSGSESGEVRNQLLINGINQIKEHPFLGEGFASFYRYQDSGYNNIYIQTFQQLGIFGGFAFCAFLFYPLLYKVKFYRKIPLYISLISLWFIGDFWLPQIFFSYMVLNDEV